MNEHWPVPVIRLQPLLDPDANGVLVHAEKLGDLLHGIRAVELDEASVWPAAHGCTTAVFWKAPRSSRQERCIKKLALSVLTMSKGSAAQASFPQPSQRSSATVGAGGESLSPVSSVQPCNRSGFGSNSIAGGRGSPNTSRAGGPFRSSKFRKTPASRAALTRRDTTDLSSCKIVRISDCLTSSFPRCSSLATASTVSRISGLIVTSAPSATRSARSSWAAA